MKVKTEKILGWGLYIAITASLLFLGTSLLANNSLTFHKMLTIVKLGTVFSYTYDTTTPAGTDAPSVIDDRIREVKSAVQERENVDHYWPITGSQVSDTAAGQHRKIEFFEPISTPSNAANKFFIYSKDVAGKAELHVLDEDGNEIQLTTAGKIKKSVIEDSAFVPPGLVSPYAGSSAPTGYLLCNGAAVSRTTYADLFAVIGTTHGVGDGSTTFNIPDLVGYFVRGLDVSGAVDADSRTLGSTQQDGVIKHYHNVPVATYGESSLGQNVQRGSAAEQDITNVNKSTGPYDIGDNSYIGITETRPKNVALNYIIKT